MSTSNKLKAVVDAWTKEVEQSLYRVENNLREAANFPKMHFRMVLLPRDMLRMLNWKVWCQRYHVPLDFIMTFVLKHYQLRRQRSADPAILVFGLSAKAVTSEVTRRRLQQEIARSFPTQDNRLVNIQPLAPIEEMPYDPDDPESMVQKYTEVMLARHRDPNYILSRKPDRRKRPYRHA